MKISSSCREFLHRIIGLSLGGFSGVTFGIGLLCIKKSNGMGYIEKTFLWTLFGFMFFAIYSLIKGEPIIALRNKFAWFLGIASVVTNYGVYMSLGALSFGDLNAIYYSAPIFVGILAYFILKDPYGIYDILITIVMVIGVMFVVQPTFLKQLFGIHVQKQFLKTIPDNNVSSDKSVGIRADYMTAKPIMVNKTADFVLHNYALNWTSGRSNKTVILKQTDLANEDGFKLSRIEACILVSIAAIASAFTYIFSRKATELSPITLACHVNLMSCLVGIPVLSAMELWRFPGEVAPWLWLGAGVLGINLGVILCLLAVHYETATAVAMARALEIPFSYVLQIVFFRDIPTALNISGAILVTVSVIVYSGRRYWQERKANDEEREKLRKG
jgi:drug/metabolite transporter (DMT)-like permease